MIRLLYADPKLIAEPRDFKLQYDMYSFALILIEIFTERLPFLKDVKSKNHKTYKYLIRDKVSRGRSFEPNMDGVPVKLQPLISACLSRRVESRPPIEQMFDSIKRMRPSRKGIVDSMMQSMEAHMRNLEQTVEQRTAEGTQMSERMRELIHEVLPPAIANKLFEGERVPPESFDMVSMFFSDIVGFTTISSRSSPIEVMQFLNDLWVTFDSTICLFDVYKIDTIGDAYMVASGIPNRNGHAHYKEISNMCLALLEQCNEFEIHHMPKEKLRIRIGLHSGPVSAGLVGMSMPQYCVFGETVNMVMMMEATSEAMRVQMSSVMHAGLRHHFPEFITTRRGVRHPDWDDSVEDTFWLKARVSGNQIHESVSAHGRKSYRDSPTHRDSPHVPRHRRDSPPNNGSPRDTQSPAEPRRKSRKSRPSHSEDSLSCSSHSPSHSSRRRSPRHDHKQGSPNHKDSPANDKRDRKDNVDQKGAMHKDNHERIRV